MSLRKAVSDIPRYIDLDKAIERLNASPAFPNMGMDGYFLLGVVKNLLEKQPTAAVVEVVRCKDCVNSDPLGNKERQIWCTFHDEVHFENSYCSYGEKKTEGGKIHK